MDFLANPASAYFNNSTSFMSAKFKEKKRISAVNLPSSQEIYLQDKRTATEEDGCLDKMPLKELGKKKQRAGCFIQQRAIGKTRSLV